MSEEDCEIEYLEEDEEIVQHCVQVAQTTPIVTQVFTLNTEDDLEEKITPLLIERKPVESKRKVKEEEPDSDYDPTEDLQPPKKRTKKAVKKPPKTSQANQQKNAKTNQKQAIQVKIKEEMPSPEKNEDYLDERKRLDIKLPDYEDPLCLPVRALKKDNSSDRNLKHWNNICLDGFRKADSVLKADNGTAKASVRTVVLRNVKNKYSGIVETTVWGKTHVESENKMRKSEVYQSVLPRYRERKLLKSYSLSASASNRDVRHHYEVLLTKEDHKEGEVLVAYKPKEGISAVYKSTSWNSDESNDEVKNNSIKEVACCKMCAQCYQTSWRGVRRTHKKDNIRCKICSHTYVSVYNLLSHLRTHHSNSEVNRHRSYISRALANVVDYHYKCRLCQQKFLTIKLLRRHVGKVHKSIQPFLCEIGNHMAS